MNKIRPEISGNFIIRVAELYTDFNRAIMEYVDNSIDSAEHYFNLEKNSYKRKIEIHIELDSKGEKISIEDNCRGIQDLNSLVSEIGNSEKKADFTTNGKFGFGIYSFMSGCEQLRFESLYEENDQAFSLLIEKQSFKKDKLEDVTINRKNKLEKRESGTKVILSGFEKEVWQSIEKKQIVGDIAEHFELLLG